jgi:MOSC domain-containing protein YiiM
LRTLNLDEARQADLSVHGGASTAVYCYPVARYEYWKAELPGAELPVGSFRENFTVDGLVEDLVDIGDRFDVGLRKSWLLNRGFRATNSECDHSDELTKGFLASCRTGFYEAVTREGRVGAGDEIVSGREPGSVPVPRISRHCVTKNQAAVTRQTCGEL